MRQTHKARLINGDHFKAVLAFRETWRHEGSVIGTRNAHLFGIAAINVTLQPHQTAALIRGRHLQRRRQIF